MTPNYSLPPYCYVFRPFFVHLVRDRFCCRESLFNFGDDDDDDETTGNDIEFVKRCVLSARIWMEFWKFLCSIVLGKGVCGSPDFSQWIDIRLIVFCLMSRNSFILVL